MENEKMNELEEIVEEATCECVEDCVEEIEECVEAAEEAVETAAQKMARKCQEAKNACCGSVARVARVLKESNYNPYIKQTRTYKLEIYRNCNEEEPIDSYEATDVKSFSACALAVATAATAALVIATKCIAKKLIK